jgi:RNA polymerase sigma-70 factor (ECF subfamily)
MTSSVDDLLLANRDDESLIIETLVDEFYGYVFRLALSIVHDPDEAEDAVQETFITAFLKLDQYQSGSNIKAWISAIVVNICRNQLRKQKRRNTRQMVWHTIQSLTGSSDSPENAAIRMEEDSQLFSALNALGEKHRLPLILRFVHGLPVREIADIMELKPGTVHSRLHYGIKKLQKKMVVGDDLSVSEVWEVLP